MCITGADMVAMEMECLLTLLCDTCREKAETIEEDPFNPLNYCLHCQGLMRQTEDVPTEELWDAVNRLSIREAKFKQLTLPFLGAYEKEIFNSSKTIGVPLQTSRTENAHKLPQNMGYTRRNNR